MTPRSAVILLGGLGTRLRPFTLNTPKPLLPLVGRPMIVHQIDRLRRAGVRGVVLALGYKADQFRRVLGDGRRLGVKLVYSPERTPLGTGGAIALAARHVSGPTFVLNGDTLTDLDFGALSRFHARNQSEASFSLVAVPDPSMFGVIETGSGGRVRAFLEKPSPGQTPAKTINAGCYLFEPSVFQAIPSGRAVSVEREVFPALLKAGRRLFGLLHDGYWSDVGTLEAYHRAHRDILLGRVRGALSGVMLRKGVWGEPGARLHKSVKTEGTFFVGAKARLDAGVVLSGWACIGPGARIEKGAEISESVLHAGVRVGAGAAVVRALVGKDVVLGPESRVTPGSALGPGSFWSGHSRPFGSFALEKHPKIG